jgi:alpha-tubulin suppressor-like RCC1 family protein
MSAPISRCLFSALALAAVACGGSDTTSGPGTPPPVAASAVVIGSLPDTIGAGDSLSVTAVVTSSNGSTIASPQLAWQSSDTALARVDNSGRVTTFGVGSFTLTVTAIAPGTKTSVSGTKSLYAIRTVENVVVTRSAGTDTLTMGDSTQFSVVARDGLGAVYPGAIVSWRVSDTAAASISSSGVVLARAMGRDTIVATAIGPAGAVRGTVTGQAGVTVRLAFTKIEAGTEHTCGLARGGSIYCWGEGAWGRLGDGVNYPEWTSVAHPVRVLSSASFTSLSLDEQADSRSGHTCATTTDEALYCWGSGSWGMLGDGADGQGIPPHASSIPIRVGSGAFVDVAVGGKDTCALTASGDVYCAGSNYGDQLGVDTVTTSCLEPQVPNGYAESCSSSFVKVSGGDTFARIYSGLNTTCGLTSAGEALCWGWNPAGEAGVGSFDRLPTPTAVVGGLKFSTLTGGSAETCGLTMDGTAYCWGRGGFGELGDGTQQPSTVPIAVTTASRFTQISAGGDHVCALTAAGDAYCWGVNSSGELGVATSESCNGNSTYSLICSTQPVQPVGVPKLIGIAAGATYTCGLVADGSVYCWGGNDRGQLGNGTSVVSSMTPVRVKDTP